MNKMKCRNLSVLASVGLAVLLLLAQTNAALAATAPSLGVATSFGVLGASAVTNTGPSVIYGDLGLYPGPSVTGFAIPPANTVVEGPGSTGLIGGSGLVTGTIYIAHAVAQQAQLDATTAYNALAGQPVTQNLTGQDLGSVGVLTPGVYHFDTSAGLTGTLTLNALNDPDSVFIFQIGSTLTTASYSKVVVINAPSNWCNKYWQVGSSATLGTYTEFVGNILAHDTITLNTGASLYGRALALNYAVTLDTNTITVPVCATTPFPTPTLSGWGFILLIGLLVAVGFFALRKSGKLRLG